MGTRTIKDRPPVGPYRALTDLSLRKRPDQRCQDWHEWAEGDVFTPPAHMNIERCLERGIIEPADGEPPGVKEDAAPMTDSGVGLVEKEISDES